MIPQPSLSKYRNVTSQSHCRICTQCKAICLSISLDEIENLSSMGNRPPSSSSMSNRGVSSRMAGDSSPRTERGSRRRGVRLSQWCPRTHLFIFASAATLAVLPCRHSWSQGCSASGRIGGHTKVTVAARCVSLAVPICPCRVSM